MDYSLTSEIQAQILQEAKEKEQHLKEAEKNRKIKPVVTDALIKALESMPEELELVWLNCKGEWLYAPHSPKITSESPILEKHRDQDRIFKPYHVSQIREIASKK